MTPPSRHIKASSPRFNSIVIIGCLMLYCVPVFSTISLTGDYLKVDFEKLIPTSCEVSISYGTSNCACMCSCTVSLKTLLFPLWVCLNSMMHVACTPSVWLHLFCYPPTHSRLPNGLVTLDSH